MLRQRTQPAHLVAAARLRIDRLLTLEEENRSLSKAVIALEFKRQHRVARLIFRLDGSGLSAWAGTSSKTVTYRSVPCYFKQSPTRVAQSQLCRGSRVGACKLP
jgi:hypothetical protein